MARNYIYYGERTLHQLLEDKTIAQLKDIARLIGIRFKNSPQKFIIVHALADFLTERPENVVKGMFYYELKACLDVMEGKMTYEYADKSGLLFGLNRFGFIYAVIAKSKSDKKRRVVFVKEMEEVLRPLIPAEMKRRESDGALLAEQMFLGCANLYGFTDLSYMWEYKPEFEKYLGRTIREEEFGPLLRPAYSAASDLKGDCSSPVNSPFSVYNGFDVDKEGSVEWREEPNQFDMETILGYGKMPYPEIVSSATEELRKVLEKYGKPGISPEQVIRDLWIRKQDEYQNTGIPNFDDFLEFDDDDDFADILGVIIDFENAVPYWRLRGNSSEEVGQREMAGMRQRGEMPRISIGPNLRAMGIESFEQIQEMALRGKSFPPFPGEFTSNKKVGRNDPCHCGSGKKYKHCCGKK